MGNTPEQTETDAAAATPVKRKHRANYSRNKLEGGWNVSVIGPNAHRFASKQVPVTDLKGEETVEELGGLIWSGPCKLPGFEGQNSALYHLVSKPRGEVDFEF